MQLSKMHAHVKERTKPVAVVCMYAVCLYLMRSGTFICGLFVTFDELLQDCRLFLVYSSLAAVIMLYV